MYIHLKFLQLDGEPSATSDSFSFFRLFLFFLVESITQIVVKMIFMSQGFLWKMFPKLSADKVRWMRLYCTAAFGLGEYSSVYTPKYVKMKKQICFICLFYCFYWVVWLLSRILMVRTVHASVFLHLFLLLSCFRISGVSAAQVEWSSFIYTPMSLIQEYADIFIFCVFLFLWTQLHCSMHTNNK